MEGGQEAATLMLRGRHASLVRLMPSLCTGMVNTMAVQRCWLARGCEASCCGGHSAGSCVQTLLAAVPSSLQTRCGSCRASAASSVAIPPQRPVLRHCSLWHPSRLQTRESCEGSCCTSWGAYFPGCQPCADVLFLAALERLQARH